MIKSYMIAASFCRNVGFAFVTIQRCHYRVFDGMTSYRGELEQKWGTDKELHHQ